MLRVSYSEALMTFVTILSEMRYRIKSIKAPQSVHAVVRNSKTVKKKKMLLLNSNITVTHQRPL